MEQRLRLLDVAERLDAWIIEDDFDGEYRFQGRPIPAMQGADRSDRVIYLGTFAKLLFPALRLGFMVVPEPLLKGIGLALRITGQFAPLLLQAALADFINQGYMSTHLKRMRRIYSARRESLSQTGRSPSRRLDDTPPDRCRHPVRRRAACRHERPSRRGGRGSAWHQRVTALDPLSAFETAGGLIMGYAATNETVMRQGFKASPRALRDVAKTN